MTRSCTQDTTLRRPRVWLGALLSLSLKSLILFTHGPRILICTGPDKVCIWFSGIEHQGYLPLDEIFAFRARGIVVWPVEVLISSLAGWTPVQAWVAKAERKRDLLRREGPAAETRRLQLSPGVHWISQGSQHWP